MRSSFGWAALVAVMMGSGMAAPMAIAAGEEAAAASAPNAAAGNETGAATGSGTGADSGSGMRGSITGGIDSASTARGATAGPPVAPSKRVTVTAIYALEAAEKAADDARNAMRRGEWGAARAYARNVGEWVGLASRAAKPVGAAATRWEMAAREAKRLDAALLRRDEGQARWADRALTLALADARTMLATAGGGGGGAAPSAKPSATPDPKSPEVRFEDVPLNKERPWTQRL